MLGGKYIRTTNKHLKWIITEAALCDKLQGQ